MKAPTEIIDLLQTILGIYFFEIPNNNRAILILSDNLAEISCKLKILEKNPSLDLRKVDFPELLKKATVKKFLTVELMKFHKIRNEFQHKSPLYTIEKKPCSDSILTTVELIRHLWKKEALSEIPDWVNCGLRIVNLYSSKGKIQKQKEFENYLLHDLDLYINKNITETRLYISEDGILGEQGLLGAMDLQGNTKEKRIPKKNEAILQVYSKQYWTFLLQNHTSLIDEILSELNL
jgi:hypothetical protein